MKALQRTYRQPISLVRVILSMLWMMGSVGGPVRADAALTDIIGPLGSGRFGTTTTVLPNGNIVVTDPQYSEGGVTHLGAVYLYNGATLTLISMLKGSTANDQVGASNVTVGVTVLPNGNYVVSSPEWDNGATVDAGAATFCSSTTGCTGTVNAANSLIGTTARDFVSNLGVTVLADGHYVVSSPSWDNGAIPNAGAVTLCSGTTGCTGTINAANSLTGSAASASVGYSGVTALANGNYVVRTPYWNNGAAPNVGAVTFCNGTTGCAGEVVSATNSLIGTSAQDNAGSSGVTALTNGNYVVSSYVWDNSATPNVGAVTFCNGTTGCTGTISATNSLIGTTFGDLVGYSGVIALADGNYVVRSPLWNSGATLDVGAVTFCNGTTGCTGEVVSATNSLLGTTQNDGIGARVTVLADGHYVVSSPSWDNGATINVGAVTFCNGTTGCTGTINAANSLTGSAASASVGYSGVTALANGNYVVRTPYWDNGAAPNVGAVTFCNGTTGCAGEVVSATNSLIGTSAQDNAGSSGVTALPNGNYVVSSPEWDNGAIQDVGAVTLCSGAMGCTGMVTTAANSLIGTTVGDQVGYSGVTVLPTGDYVVRSPFWDNGAISDAGAVTWCTGAAGCTGPAISAANSVLGTIAGSTVSDFSYDALRNRLAVGKPAENLVSLFSLTLTYPFTGFFQPVDNLPTFNSVKAGQGIPVKFSLGGNYGLNILATGSPTSQQIACPSGGLVDDIEQVVTASNSGLQYDAATDAYTYVWKTQRAWAGQCRQFTLTLTDGTSHLANFQFK